MGLGPQGGTTGRGGVDLGWTFEPAPAAVALAFNQGVGLGRDARSYPPSGGRNAGPARREPGRDGQCGNRPCLRRRGCSSPPATQMDVSPCSVLACSPDCRDLDSLHTTSWRRPAPGSNTTVKLRSVSSSSCQTRLFKSIPGRSTRTARRLRAGVQPGPDEVHPVLTGRIASCIDEIR
jgi:hypothetical protein